MLIAAAKVNPPEHNRYADIDRARAVIEVLAALAGSALTVGAMGIGGAFNRSREGRDTVVRLTTAVESVAKRLDEIHVDMKADRQQTYSLFSDLDRRVTKLEAKP